MNSVRIIGGEWRRRQLRFPDALGLRPTPDRVRETLFNWLGQSLDGLSCLDLFAGSGALGFEAASRGAAKVVLVERSPAAAASLRANLKLLNAQTLHLWQGDALQFAPASPDRFDVIFLDPPYRQGWLDRIAPFLDRLAKPGARVYAEAEAELVPWPGWTMLRQGNAGQVFYHLLEREEPNAR